MFTSWEYALMIKKEKNIETKCWESPAAPKMPKFWPNIPVVQESKVDLRVPSSNSAIRRSNRH